MNDYLATEGFLVLMLIRSNTQDWYCRVLVSILWKRFIKLKQPNNNEYNNELGGGGNDMSTVKVNDRYNINDNVNVTPVNLYSNKANELQE